MWAVCVCVCARVCVSAVFCFIVSGFGLAAGGWSVAWLALQFARLLLHDNKMEIVGARSCTHTNIPLYQWNNSAHIHAKSYTYMCVCVCVRCSRSASEIYGLNMGFLELFQEQAQSFGAPSCLHERASAGRRRWRQLLQITANYCKWFAYNLWYFF